jgi:hypothetical protein
VVPAPLEVGIEGSCFQASTGNVSVTPLPGKKINGDKKKKKERKKINGGVATVVQCLPTKCKPSINPQYPEKKKNPFFYSHIVEICIKLSMILILNESE